MLAVLLFMKQISTFQLVQVDIKHVNPMKVAMDVFRKVLHIPVPQGESNLTAFENFDSLKSGKLHTVSVVIERHS